MRLVITILVMGLMAGSASAALYLVNAPAAADGGLVVNYETDDDHTPDSHGTVYGYDGTIAVANGVRTQTGNSNVSYVATTGPNANTGNYGVVGDSTEDFVVSFDMIQTARPTGSYPRAFQLQNVWGGGTTGDIIAIHAQSDGDIDNQYVSYTGDSWGSNFVLSSGWHTWQFMYDASEDSWDMSVDDTVILPDFAPINAGVDRFDYIIFGQNTNPTDTTFDLDNVIASTDFVPEPATMIVLALGAVVTLIRRKRRC